MKEINLLKTTDAEIWAKEFVRIKDENNWTLEDIDEGLMISWFSNAIITGRDITSGSPLEKQYN